MARLDIIGTDDLLSLFDNIAEIPSDVIAEMLVAEGEVIAKEQRKAAAEMLQGPYYEGGVTSSVTPGKPKITYDGGELEISFRGTQHGESFSGNCLCKSVWCTWEPGGDLLLMWAMRAARIER